MNKLILTFITVFCLIACEKEEMQTEQFSWVGEWNATNIVINDTLQVIPFFPPGAFTEYIKIRIPEGDSGTIAGNTFYNGMGFDFKLKKDNQVEFDSYGGTRHGEDKWGTAFALSIINNVISTFQVDEAELRFYDINNKLIILFTKP